MPKAAKGGFYAVRVGKVPGVYSTWDECKAQVGGAPGAKHKKFATYEEAHEFAFPDSAPSASATTASASRSIVKVATATRTKSAPEDENEDGFMVIYTDGACKDNQGSGTEKRAGLGVWWGAGDDRNIAERCPGDQTNNRAELLALIRALETVPHQKAQKIMLKTDSKYSIQCMQDWIHNWIKNGWVKSDGKPVLNAPLIRYLHALLDERAYSGQPVKLVHVAGHAGVVGNEAADGLANKGCWMPTVPEEDWDARVLEVGTRKEQTREKLRGQPTAFAVTESGGREVQV